MYRGRKMGRVPADGQAAYDYAPGWCPPPPVGGEFPSGAPSIDDQLLSRERGGRSPPALMQPEGTATRFEGQRVTMHLNSTYPFVYAVNPLKSEVVGCGPEHAITGRHAVPVAVNRSGSSSKVALFPLIGNIVSVLRLVIRDFRAGP